MDELEKVLAIDDSIGKAAEAVALALNGRVGRVGRSEPHDETVGGEQDARKRFWIRPGHLARRVEHEEEIRFMGVIRLLDFGDGLAVADGEGRKIAIDP